MKLYISKQNLIIISVAIVLPALMSMMMYKKSSGSHPGSTGAPGELNCAQSGCHANALVNSGIGVNTLHYPVADSTYVPGATYSMTLQVQRPGVNRFGFEIVSLKDSNNTNIGQIVVTDAVRTHTTSTTIGGGLRRYLTHSTTGTTATSVGNNSWAFDWKAPATNAGNITFYFATNCTNNNNASSDDTIFLSSFKIKPKITSIEEYIQSDDFFAAYNPYSQSIEITYELKAATSVMFKLFDMQGKEIKSIEYANRGSGNYKDNIELKQQLSSGVYHLHLVVKNNSTLSKKFFIQ